MLWPNGKKTEPRRSDMYGPRAPISVPGYPPTRAFHLGQDWNIGGSVHAVAPGTVIEAGRGGDSGVGGESWMGLQVLIDHGIVEGRRLYTRSCHMSRLSVSKGSWVPEGAQLGIEGETGLAAGVHLHLEMYLDGTWRASGTNPGNTIAPIPYITNHLSDTPNSPEPEEDLPVNVQLVLYVPRNTLILVDHLNKTMRDLGNSATDPTREYFAGKPYTRAVDRGTTVPAGAVVWHDLIRVSSSNPNGEYRYL